MEKMDFSREPESVIYLAGGCFWGMEKLMRSLPGVQETTCGYANGTGAADARYPVVCGGETGFRETVRVRYDPAEVSIDRLLFAFFFVIDPTLHNRQGNDVGTQYQAGIYYTNEAARQAVERIAAVERSRVPRFAVEVGPLWNFYPAEDYHQDYLGKNPGGYCHIPAREIALLAGLRIDPGDYRRPAKELLRDRLTEEQYRVTQQSGTEAPFTNPYWDFYGRGIYVDVVTGEPLFTSRDKFESGCGWPAFSAPIEPGVLCERRDTSHGMIRTEVRSRAGDSHLGHVFSGDAESPTGTRYCINSAALRFVPYADLEAAGYGAWKDLFAE
jgi:peptide methionine sulfoxide reductase msrA/msrB